MILKRENLFYCWNHSKLRHSHWHWMLHHWYYLIKSWLTHKIEEILYTYKEVRPIYHIKRGKYGYLKATFLSSRLSSRICAFFLNCLFSPTSQGWWWPPGKFCQQRRISEGSLRRSQPWRMYWQQIFHLAFSFWYFVQIMLPVILTFFSVAIEYQNFEMVTRTFKSLKNPPWEAEQRWWCTWTKLGSCPSLQW